MLKDSRFKELLLEKYKHIIDKNALKFPADLKEAEEKGSERNLPPNTIKLWPLFGQGPELRQYSGNYPLYLDVIELTIWNLGILFVVSGLFNVLTNVFFKKPDANDFSIDNMVAFFYIFSIDNKVVSPWFLVAQILLNFAGFLLIRKKRRQIEERAINERDASISTNPDLEMTGINSTSISIKINRPLRENITEKKQAKDKGSKQDMKPVRSEFNEKKGAQLYTENQFCIVATNLPDDATESAVAKFFNKLATKRGIQKVKGVLLIHDTKELSAQKRQKFLAIQSLLKTKTEKREKEAKIKIEKANLEIQRLEGHLMNNRLFQNAAIVCFETIESAKSIKKIFHDIKKSWLKYHWILFVRFFLRSYKSEYFMKNNLIVVDEVGEPGDVIFENLWYSKSERKFRKLSAYFLLGVFIALIFLLLCIFNAGKIAEQFNFKDFDLITIINDDSTASPRAQYVDPNIQKYSGFTIYLYSFVIFVLSQALQIVVNKLTAYQLHPKKSNDQIFQLKAKLTTTFIYYNVLMNLIRIMFPTVEFLKYVTSLFMNIFGFGLLFKFVNIGYLLKLLKRRSLKKQGNNNTTAQEEANEIFRNPDYDFIAGLVNYAVITNLSITYSGLFPLGLLFGTIAAVCTLVADKFALNQSAIPPVAGNKLGLHFFRLWEMDALMQMSANIVFIWHYYRNEYLIVFLSAIYLGFYFYFSNTIRKSEKLKKEERVETARYDDVKHTFMVTFWSRYPYNPDNHKTF